MKNKLPILFLAFLFCAPAKADLNDALDSMFMVTGAEPGIYDSQRRSGVQLGYLRLRAPVGTYQLVNIARPTLASGCGGIDPFGGSFTFVNEEQFRQILRQIGANALGYAFKLALASMCKECDSILSDLQDMMNAANQTQINTCKWAKGFVNDIATQLPEKYQENWKLEETTKGNFQDSFGGVIEVFENWGSDVNGGDADGEDDAQPDTGNYTWNALVRRGGASAGSDFNFLEGNVNHDELLMNIAGTYIFGVTAADSKSGLLSARLSYADFKNGKQPNADDTADSNPLWICNGSRDLNSGCMDPVEVPRWSFPGVTAWAEGKLQEAADHMANAVTANTPHTAAMQNFLGSLPFHTMRHMRELQGEGDLLNIYVQNVKPYIGSVYAASLGLTMVERIEASYDDVNSPYKVPQITEAVKEFKRQAEEDRMKVQEEYMDEILKVEELVEKLSKMSRSESAIVQEKG